jgi:II/X family phage/plasmid replication protein
VYFIDWLKVTQTHPEGGLPLVGDEMITAIDLETGEPVRESPNMKRLEGSYSSKLSIRCDGSIVTMDGNPSRWHRLDNLFGLRTFDEAIRVYNTILKDYGLPPFTKNTELSWLQGSDGKRASRVGNGASILRVDWTQNLEVGPDNQLPFLRALSTQSTGKGKQPQLYANGQTVDWARRSTLWYLKAYNKAHELREHLTKTRRKTLSDEDLGYLENLIEYCEQYGIVRTEKEFKSAFLRRKNLCYYGMTEESDFLEYLTDIDEIVEKVEMATVDYETIADQLLDKNVVKSRQSANATQGYALAWLHGQNLKQTMGRSQFYEHKRRLLALGLDISNPCDVTRLPQITREREICVRPALPPSWYRMPEKTHLRLVA